MEVSSHSDVSLNRSESFEHKASNDSINEQVSDNLSQISVVPSAEQDSLSSKAETSNQADNRVPNIQSDQSLSLKDITSLAEQTIYQNKHYKADFNQLLSTQKRFKQKCPAGGYNKQALDNALSLIIQMKKRYVLTNDKSQNIHAQVEALKSTLKEVTHPNTVIESKQTLFSIKSDKLEQKDVQNFGFDTVKMAEAIAEITQENHEEKNQLINEIAPDLIDHFNHHASLYKRLPMIKALINQGQHEAAIESLENSIDQFKEVSEEYRHGKSEKAFKAINQFIEYTQSVQLENDTDRKQTLYTKALEPLATSSSLRLNTFARNISSSIRKQHEAVSKE